MGVIEYINDDANMTVNDYRVTAIAPAPAPVVSTEAE